MPILRHPLGYEALVVNPALVGLELKTLPELLELLVLGLLLRITELDPRAFSFL
jgi:hypothetical protein